MKNGAREWESSGEDPYVASICATFTRPREDYSREWIEKECRCIRREENIDHPIFVSSRYKLFQEINVLQQN